MSSTSMAISAEIRQEIMDFLYREARLLDLEDYDGWLAMLAPDIRYWIPTIPARYRRDGGSAPSRLDAAHIEDRLPDLQRRVKRFKDPSAWAEDPPTRHCHVITNIEIETGEEAGEYRVYSAFVNCRGRFDTDENIIIGRREDVIRKRGGYLLLVERKVLMTQNVLLGRNINTFL